MPARTQEKTLSLCDGYPCENVSPFGTIGKKSYLRVKTTCSIILNTLHLSQRKRISTPRSSSEMLV